MPGADVVVHVEPRGADAALTERALAAALHVPNVREIHNLSLLRVGDRTELSLHLKLPGSLSLAEAHDLATELEEAVLEAVPEIDRVQTHLEPLAAEAEGRPLPAGDVEAEAARVKRIVEDETGRPPRELRLYQTDAGLVAFLTLGMAPGQALSEAHAHASDVEERIRRAYPDLADVTVHTEP